MKGKGERRRRSLAFVLMALLVVSRNILVKQNHILGMVHTGQHVRNQVLAPSEAGTLSTASMGQMPLAFTPADHVRLTLSLKPARLSVNVERRRGIIELEQFNEQIVRRRDHDIAPTVVLP